MKDTEKPPAIRSILVALDDACSDHETMETAAHLAADLHAELQGLYIEDVNVLRMAALPFTEEITTASGLARPIDAESMERAMQNKAEHVRRLMERTAARAQIRCSFSVARGRVTQRALLATSEADLVLFGSRSHAPAVRPPLGARTRSAVRPIVAVVDAAAVSARTLGTAAAVSQRQERGLVVLICGSQRDVVEQLAGHVRQELADCGVDVHVPLGPIESVAALVQSARAQRAALVLVSRECRLLDEVAVQSLLENLDCSIVLV
jgi:K+-sensing histidine kinase KdpD